MCSDIEFFNNSVSGMKLPLSSISTDLIPEVPLVVNFFVSKAGKNFFTLFFNVEQRGGVGGSFRMTDCFDSFRAQRWPLGSGRALEKSG